MEVPPLEQRYSVRIEALSTALGRTLARLDGLAAGTEALADDFVAEQLMSLQYALHEAAELLFGLEPPPHMTLAHAELTSALTRARELTGEIAEAVSEGGADHARLLVPEWRGTLFAVRLAQMRLVAPPETANDTATLPRLTSQARHVAALVLLAGGTGAFSAGATLNALPVWTAGIAAMCGSMLVYRH